MRNIKFNILAGFLSATLLTACNAVWNGEGDNPTIAERHPIAVDSQVVTMTLDIDPTTNELSSIDRSRIKAFALAFMQNGHGTLTVTAPTGGGDDLVGQETSSDIRKHLFNLGVPYEAITGASYRAGGSGGEREVVLSYTHYVATPSPCGIWDSEFKHNYKNVVHPNFGCADQNNLAAMIADPRDLIEPAASTPVDAAQRVRGVRTFRSGEVTSRERDDTIETNVTN